MGHDAFLTGKAAARGEIDIYKLSESDRALFDASMAKEWASWQKFGAVDRRHAVGAHRQEQDHVS